MAGVTGVEPLGLELTGTPADGVQADAERLRAGGTRLLAGVVADCGGVLRAKLVPSARMETFARCGMGISPTWAVFCVDKVLAMTDDVNVVGDLRLSADLQSAVVLDDGLAWAPADVHTQDGDQSPLCWRDVVRRQAGALRDRGVEATVGAEVEFVLLDDQDHPVDAQHWPPYGLAPVASHSGLLSTLVDRLAQAGLPPEQLHAEYGDGQFEVSLPPRDPVAAADAVLLARTVICRAARAHGLLVSFSPMPFPGGTGNGAHLHMSFTRDGLPLLSGGPHPGGLTDDGRHLLAGILASLPQGMAVLAGSVVSADRLQPDHWAGPFTSWGVENRETAVRLVRSNAGNPYGAHLEVRCVDASANPYLATGLLLGAAAAGLDARRAPAGPVGVNPASLSADDATRAAVTPLHTSAPDCLDAFERGALVRAVLGPALHAAVAAVRRHEYHAFADGQVDRHAATRFAWSA